MLGSGHVHAGLDVLCKVLREHAVKCCTTAIAAPIVAGGGASVKLLLLLLLLLSQVLPR
jgi:hypothetical protein